MSVVSTILQNKYIHFCTNTSDEFMCTEYEYPYCTLLVHTVSTRTPYIIVRLGFVLHFSQMSLDTD